MSQIEGVVMTHFLLKERGPISNISGGLFPHPHCNQRGQRRGSVAESKALLRQESEKSAWGYLILLLKMLFLEKL